MELEALEAIYADLFAVVSQRGDGDGAPLAWKVHLEPTEGGEGEVNHGGLGFGGTREHPRQQQQQRKQSLLVTYRRLSASAM